MARKNSSKVPVIPALIGQAVRMGLPVLAAKAGVPDPMRRQLERIVTEGVVVDIPDVGAVGIGVVRPPTAKAIKIEVGRK